MGLYEVVIILICLSAAFGFINQKFLKLPFVIGLFFLSTALSVLVISSQFWMDINVKGLKAYIENSHLDKLIIDVFLGFLLEHFIPIGEICDPKLNRLPVLLWEVLFFQL